MNQDPASSSPCQPSCAASCTPSCAPSCTSSGASSCASACTSSGALSRLRVTATGQVQGVGFRPFVFRLAAELELTGVVGNTSRGVNIEVQGRPEQVRAFPGLLRDRLPPLAHLTGLVTEELDVVPDETGFRIVASQGRHGHSVLISPDVGICSDCLADMQDPANHRYLYPFTNCTNCGPRYTITRSIPYDRAVTSMACFPMCELCAEEYHNPLDRRFHAQPIACPVCGPALWFTDNAAQAAPGIWLRTAALCTDALTAAEGRRLRQAGTGEPAAETDFPRRDRASQLALAAAARALVAGKILAVRGLGGFQLACDAGNAQSVDLLRVRKKRPHKSFALMVPDLAAVRRICLSSGEDEALLSSPARPALILPKRENVEERYRVAETVAPDLATLAVMLPTTPLHVVLFHYLERLCAAQGRPVPALVMTSGNASGDPICLGNREAARRLAGTADCFLLHDRDILCRVDDSVVQLDRAQKPPAPLFFRRARGYVPSPVELGREGPCILGTGADLKATVCLTRKSHAFVGQHTGDLDNVATAGFYREVLTHLQQLLEVEPRVIVTDLHPDFFSSRCGAELAAEKGIPLLRLQHHAAHAAAVLAEHHVTGPALALVLDGFGLGEDGTVWGGELLSMDLARASWRREGHLAPFALPGGDRATRAPWRIALGLARELGDKRRVQDMLARYGKEAETVCLMCERNLNTPLSSSCGRLFDAVSALLGVSPTISYEGQAAIRLERLALARLGEALPSKKAVQHCLAACQETRSEHVVQQLVSTHAHGRRLLSSHTLFARAAALQDAGLDQGLIALDFHHCLAQGLCLLAKGSMQPGTPIALAGGVINNSILRTLLCAYLAEQGCSVLLPRQLPPGDGGISLGQAAMGLSVCLNGSLAGAGETICQSRQ